MQLKQLSFAGVLTLSSIAACVDDPADQLGVEEQLETSGTSGTSGTCSNPVYNNPMYLNQRLPVACETSCIGSGAGYESVTWRLVASKFTVANTCSMGKHTGVGVTGSSKNTSLWTTTGPVLHTSNTGWSAQGLAMWTFNHGRTVDPNAYATAATITLDFGSGTSMAIRNAVGQCIATAMSDGFCDSMCGNDAYTIPPEALVDNEQQVDGNWLLRSTQPFSNRKTYGDTHLVKGRWYTDVGLVVCTGPDVDPMQVFPHYGHNSNTDANAQLTMFRYCNSLKSTLQSSCDVSQVDLQIKRYVLNTCDAVCGGYRRRFWDAGAHFAKDQLVGNKALRDSSLPGAPSSANNSGPQPIAGSVLDTPNSWGYPVNGM